MRTCMSLFARTSSCIIEWRLRLFIDQPVGVGFSYGSKTVGTSQQAAADVWKFLQIWFADPRFKQYAVRDFGIWSESYGGHYGPTFASCVTWNR
jgi:carboxypeptidase C (cathepsin A)